MKYVLGSLGGISKETREEIYRQQSEKCARCGRVISHLPKKSILHHIDESGSRQHHQEKEECNSHDNLIYYCIICHNLIHQRINLCGMYLKKGNYEEQKFMQLISQYYWFKCRGMSEKVKGIEMKVKNGIFHGELELESDVELESTSLFYCENCEEIYRTKKTILNCPVCMAIRK